MDSILMTEPSPIGDKAEFESRLKRVRGTGQQLDSALASGQQMGSGLALGMRITTELVATIAVGVGTGLLLDAWLETKPWFLIGFILLGAVAGMLNVFRLATGQNRVAGYDRSSDSDEPANEEGG